MYNRLKLRFLFDTLHLYDKIKNQKYNSISDNIVIIAIKSNQITLQHSISSNKYVDERFIENQLNN